jgi:UDP-3-O-[3-hydroxymyristoyl] glucosamine N-acyltransferase
MRIAPTPVKEIAALIGATVKGNDSVLVTGFNEIHRVEGGDCLFVDHPKYYAKALESAATTIIIDNDIDCPPGKCLLVHPQPFTAFNRLTRHFSRRSLSRTPLSESAKVAASSVILPGAYVGDNVVIGENCVIHPNVVIYDNCSIGNNVVIHAGAVIGSDGFYFRKRPAAFEPLYNCGTVVIEDNVVIGAGCTIDRGVTDVTRIGKGSILDNLVHVGHDVIIGELCLFAAQVGIAGAVTIGNKVTVWGQAGISSGITIGEGATILAQSGVGENVPAGATWFGTPAASSREKMKEIFALKQLPGLLKKLYGKA